MVLPNHLLVNQGLKVKQYSLKVFHLLSEAQKATTTEQSTTTTAV
jgi:hypothetical protein